MSDSDVTVRSLAELIEQVTPEASDDPSGRRRNYSVYRGSADASAPLLTSLDQLGGQAPHSQAHLEQHILRNFMRYSGPYVDPGLRHWELLFTAQHHGLPTRLLDWSYSPLVAAHFATLTYTDSQASNAAAGRIVWRLDWRRVHERFGLRPLAFLIEDLETALAERGVGSVWEFFEASHGRDGAALAGGFACLLEPPALDARITAQSAAFTISSDPTRSLDAFLEAHDLRDALSRILIPPEAVDLVRDQLDLCAIDERRLFPDLDGVAREVARYYSSSTSPANAPLRPLPNRR